MMFASLTMLFVSAAVLLRILSNPLGNVFQKQLTAKGHPALLVNCFTYAVLSICCLPLVFHVSWTTFTFDFWLYSLLGGIFGALGNGLLIKALQSGDLSVLGPVNSYKAVVGVLIGILLLGEIPNLWGLSGILLIIWGSYFVLDTTEDKFSWALLKRKEIQYRIYAMILTAIEAVFVKKVILASSAMVAFISWCWMGAFFSFLLLLWAGINFKSQLRQFSRGDLIKFLYLVICIGTMQYTTNYVFDHMQVGYALSLFQLSTIVSVLLGYRIFKEQQVIKKLAGSAIMLVGSVVIILLKSK